MEKICEGMNSKEIEKMQRENALKMIKEKLKKEKD